ncbi:MAG: hypothetical protein BRD44_01470 [Bacteroidetes bacterium QS_7_67_15]|nr:MAG: hypothetical protein BRD44_01470 [Bacteroidetes bacterium QS_7_67_15]
MPITFSPVVRNAWGDEVTDEVARVLDETFEQRTVSREEWREVLGRLDRVEEHLDHLGEEVSHQRREIGELRREMNARFDAMNARLDERLDQQSAQFDKRFATTNERIDKTNERIDAMNERFDAMNEAMRVQTRWTIGTIALFGTIIAVLIAVVEFAAG